MHFEALALASSAAFCSASCAGVGTFAFLLAFLGIALGPRALVSLEGLALDDNKIGDAGGVCNSRSAAALQTASVTLSPFTY